MKEPMDNVGYVCPYHAPKAGKWSDVPMEDFIGKYVKLSFRGNGEDRRVEHMWVDVKEIDSENGVMVGILNNDPVIVTHLRDGDTIRCQPWEVEDLLEG